MQSKATTVDHYISELPEERKKPVTELRNVISKNLPAGFEETIGYGMIAYVVPHRIYPKGYHSNPKLPLPFINIASQKNHIAVYHMGLYAKPDLLDWFKKEYAQRTSLKLDMGGSCIRFRKMADIPYSLFGDLASRITVEEWIDNYEKNIRR